MFLGLMHENQFAFALISSTRTPIIAIVAPPSYWGGAFISPLFLCYPLALYIAVCHYIDMFCINCFNKSTAVANSRPNKKQPQVWRRRSCSNCHATFTTYERPSLADNKLISLPDSTTDTFNLGRLILSIAKAFTHSPNDAKYNTLWLAQTVEDILSTERQTLHPDDIAATTHQVLKKFDELAAVQYAAQHQLISSTRRRGRPSLREHGPHSRE